MNPINFSSIHEKKQFLSAYKKLLLSTQGTYSKKEFLDLKNMLKKAVNNGLYKPSGLNIHPLIEQIHAALIISDEVGLKKASIISALLYNVVENTTSSIKQNAEHQLITLNEVRLKFGESVEKIIKGLQNTTGLYLKDAAIDSENFPKLLLVLAEDVRVVLILIADRLNKMRLLRHSDDEKLRVQVAKEASSLYAPLAHKLGLYSIKSEMEDTALKYTNRVIYNNIAKKLNETKKSRDIYIDAFIAPIEKKLNDAGLKFDIKGRTKSIYSIWNKIKKQQTDFENIYDLFAVRVILESAPDKEKAECWQVYSLITDMYQPNPKRLKDWLSIPKSNGYESLHTTVMGHDGKWVEVQIRTKRMDEIAERGFAAHWKYKGVKSESGLDDWLTNVRVILESHQENSPEEIMTNFKLDLYEKEIYVFTPKGDLFKLPKGSTVLDFAYAVHSDVGNRCVGGKINGKNVPIRHVLKSSDQIAILTSPNQTPKMDWLNFVRTSKARVKIKQTIKELESKSSEYGKELLSRRFKNKKIDFEESTLMRLIKKLGYKSITDFFVDIASEKLDVNQVIEQYSEQEAKEKDTPEIIERSAESFVSPTPFQPNTGQEDTLVIDENLKGLDYRLGKCCSPIYGDEIFGFVSSQGGIKIHRMDCKNAPEIISRYGYRVVKAKWAGKAETRYPATLHVVGHDDIGIVTNISSVIAKEKNVSLRSIDVNSSDGLFLGNVTVFISDTSQLNHLIAMIKTIKGVKSVERINT